MLDAAAGGVHPSRAAGLPPPRAARGRVEPSPARRRARGGPSPSAAQAAPRAGAPAGRVALGERRPSAREHVGEVEGHRALERAAGRAGLEDARRVAILAFADELIADPSLLRAYGSVVSGADDATLVIVTADPGALLPAVSAAGLDDDGSADLLAVEAAPAGVDAVFSRREHGGLPRYDETSLDGLRALIGA